MMMMMMMMIIIIIIIIIIVRNFLNYKSDHQLNPVDY